MRARIGVGLGLVLAASVLAAGEPQKTDDGGYRFENDLYRATIDPQGRLKSLKVKGEEMFSQRRIGDKQIVESRKTTFTTPV